MKFRKQIKDYLINHFVLKNGGLSQNFDGHALSGLRVPRKLNLSEGSLADGSPNLVLPNLSRHSLHLLSNFISHKLSTKASINFR